MRWPCGDERLVHAWQTARRALLRHIAISPHPMMNVTLLISCEHGRYEVFIIDVIYTRAHKLILGGRPNKSTHRGLRATCVILSLPDGECVRHRVTDNSMHNTTPK